MLQLCRCKENWHSMLDTCCRHSKRFVDETSFLWLCPCSVLLLRQEGIGNACCTSSWPFTTTHFSLQIHAALHPDLLQPPTSRFKFFSKTADHFFLEFLFWKTASVAIMFTAIYCWKHFWVRMGRTSFPSACDVQLLSSLRLCSHRLQSNLCSCFQFPTVHLATTHYAGVVGRPIHLSFRILRSICNYFQYFPCWRTLRMY